MAGIPERVTLDSMATPRHADEYVFPSRRSYLALALGFAAFAVYGSLIPFDLHRLPLTAAWDLFLTNVSTWPRRRISRSDVLANVLLFVPIGFAMAGAILADRHSRRAVAGAALVILPTTLTLSTAVEFLQLFFGERVSSSIDIAAQTAGTAIGIVGWAIAGPALTQWIRDARTTAQDDRLWRALTAYVAAWTFVSLAPFDLTVDLGDLADRVRTGDISLVPFGGPDIGWARRLWDAVAETSGALPLGVWSSLAGLRYFRGAGRFALGALLVTSAEAAQVFIGSHSANVTDLLCGLTGVGVGARISATLLPSMALPKTDSQAARVRFAFLAVLAGLVVLNCAYHWQPYDFVVDNELIRGKLARLSLVPFVMYTSGSYLNALNNLLASVALSVPLGIVSAVVLPRTLKRPVATAVVTLGALCFFAGIELGQFLLPTRTPDTTDVLIGAVGAAAGSRLGQWLLAARDAGSTMASI